MSARPHLTDDQLETFLRASTADPDAGLFNEIMNSVDALAQRRTGWPRLPGIRPVPRMVVLMVAAALMLAIIAGAIAVGANLILPPSSRCPATHNEADAIDTSQAGLPAEARAWREAGRPGGNSRELIAAIADDLPDVEMAVVGIDPRTSEQCRLLNFSSGYQVIAGGTALSWSPTGDALAIGVPERLYIWTESSLRLVWTGSSFPRVAWSPDGSSIAVASGDGNDVQLIYADGRPERQYDIGPVESSPMMVHWSPDGGTLAIGQATTGQVGSPTALSIVSVETGVQSPLDLGLDQPLSIGGWLDDRTLLVFPSTFPPPMRTSAIAVPIDAPAEHATLPMPAEFASIPDAGIEVSPDVERLVYGIDIDRRQIGIARVAGGDPIHPDTGAVGWVGWIAWAPDSGSVLLWAEAQRSIWVMAADGTGLRRVGEKVVLLGEHPWRPAPH